MFLTRLDLVALDEPGMWVLDADLIWQDLIFGRITAPKGAKTDMASVPGFMRGFMDVTGKSRRPGVIHDFVYRHPRTDDGRELGRSDCDELLRIALIAEGLSSASARVYWIGVRSGGWLPWKYYREYA